MRPSARTRAFCGPTILARVLFCLILFSFAAHVAAAQQNINPPATTVQYGGTPNADGTVSSFTAPAGGLVLTGTAISAITGKPIRYLWVGDGTFGLCRVDPEIDAPGIHSVNVNTCPFKLNGASITGGPLAFDSVKNYLYLTDIRASQGVFRLHYLPGGDNGNGFLDFNDIFGMAGNPTAARFSGGQTGCQLPANSTLAAAPKFGAANTVALAPDGSLWVGSKKTGAILRINSPGTATSTGFGTCQDFVQLVATTPDNATSNGLAWIGHDLWGTDGTGPYRIANADTTCQALGATPVTSPACVGVNFFPNVGVANSTGSDQYYPQLNGNNLYFGLGAPGNVVWEGNVANPAAQTEDLAMINQAQLVAAFPSFAALGNVGALAADYTDPANEIVFAGEDPTGVGALGLGRWFETCEGNPPAGPGIFNCPTPFATAIPGVPTVVRATAVNSTAVVDWSAAQSFQPVVFYVVRNTSASDNILLPDVIVGPGPSGFPPTTVTIGGLANGTSYTFAVSAGNGIDSSAFSADSNSIQAPGIAVPGIPTNISALAGDGAALVNWMPPAIAGGAPIISYTVRAIANNVPAGITTIVAAPSAKAILAGLTNGVSYTFSVHASNAGGNGLESTPSNPPVIPSQQPNQATVTVSGVSTLSITPTQVTYPITIQNNAPFPLANTSLTITLSQGTPDGAFLILAQPSVGTCSAGGVGVTSITCTLGGTILDLGTVTVNAIAQIQGNGVTITGTFNGLDTALNPVNASAMFVTAPPPPPTTTISAPVSLQGVAQVPNPNVGQAGNVTWTISNTSSTTAPNVAFTNTIPAGTPNGLVLNTIAVTVNNGGAFVCNFTPNSTHVTVPCPAGPIADSSGGLIVVTTPSLGGSTKNGAKPPQTMIVTTNFTAPNQHGEVFVLNGKVTFGPGGTDTLNNNVNATITVR